MKSLFFFILLFAATVVSGQQKSVADQVNALNNERDSIVLHRKLNQLAAGNENDLNILLRYYTGNRSKRDSVMTLLVKRYPKGDVVFALARSRFYTLENPASRDSMLSVLKHRFPHRDFDIEYGALAAAYAKKLNIPQAKKSLDLIKKTGQRRTAVMAVARLLVSYNPQIAEELMRIQMQSWQKEGVKDQGTPVTQLAHNEYYSAMELFASLLLKNGKYDEGLRTITEVMANNSAPSPQLTGIYGVLLSRNEHDAEALPILDKLIRDDRAGTEVKSSFITSFSRMNPSKDARLHLQDMERQINDKAEIAAKNAMIDEPAPDFSITDVNGRQVGLSDFKGKTIVLDFWATWCSPCKKSFPAMKLAVEKYSNNPNVKFLFIHTWESSKTPLEDARNYLKANNYPFDLYMDIKRPESGKNEAVMAFGITGIPAKFIIDGKGKIRYRMSGFTDGDAAALAELSYMIDNVSLSAGK